MSGASYTDRVQDKVRHLFWVNIIEVYLKSLPVLSWPVIGPVLRFCIYEFLVGPLFKELSVWGVFTTIDWKNAQQYKDYRNQAVKLVEAQGDKPWSPEDEKRFDDAARALIKYHIK